MTQPFSHLVWLGAGSAAEPAGIINQAKQTTFFEAREAACQMLRGKFKSATVKQQVITHDGGNVNFREYNLVEFSATKEATGLKKLFPGLKEKSVDQISSQAIGDAINDLKLSDSNNLLVIDIADSNLLFLKTLEQKKLLSVFSEIQIQSSNEQLYSNAASTGEIIAFLQTQGYVLQQTHSQDPDLPWHSFGLNPLWQSLKTAEQKLQAVQNELTADKQKLETAQKELATEKQRLEAAQKEFAADKQKLTESKQQFAAEKDAVVSAANKAKADVEQQLVKAQQELAKLKAAPQPATDFNQQAIEQKIQKMFADHAQQLTKEVGNLKNHINSGLGNTAKQFEAFIGIQNYLEKGIKPLNFHGWPISPDIGLHIIGLIDANDYDVIIEFGSGTSTVLMARALMAKHGMLQCFAKVKAKPNEQDISTRIVTFEHNTLYYEKTLQALKDNGVDHLVDLVHAPLIDYHFKDGSQYLYYHCNEKLQELAKTFKGRKANILVLVDGPPGATNKNARFPALPHLLNAFPEHQHTIIMDDYSRSEEKEIVELWKNILIERGISPTFEAIQSEKGLGVLSTN